LAFQLCFAFNAVETFSSFSLVTAKTRAQSKLHEMRRIILKLNRYSDYQCSLGVLDNGNVYVSGKRLIQV